MSLRLPSGLGVWSARFSRRPVSPGDVHDKKLIGTKPPAVPNAGGDGVSTAKERRR